MYLIKLNCALIGYSMHKVSSKDWQLDISFLDALRVVMTTALSKM